MDFNKLAQEINQINQEKGFNDSNNSPLETIAKIHSEIGEATLAVIDGLPPVWNGIDDKPEGEYVEICDASIRTLGYLAYRGYDFKTLRVPYLPVKGRMKSHNHLHFILSESTEIFRQNGDCDKFLDSLYSFALLCREYLVRKYSEIDFEKTMREKIEYNKTRPYRHGNKKA